MDNFFGIHLDHGLNVIGDEEERFILVKKKAIAFNVEAAIAGEEFEMAGGGGDMIKDGEGALGGLDDGDEGAVGAIILHLQVVDIKQSAGEGQGPGASEPPLDRLIKRRLEVHDGGEVGNRAADGDGLELRLERGGEGHEGEGNECEGFRRAVHAVY